MSSQTISLKARTVPRASQIPSKWQFQLANFNSAFVWAAVLLTLGDVVGKLLGWVGSDQLREDPLFWPRREFHHSVNFRISAPTMLQ
jgi:hypothetical protein